jgi:hypothetical protein
VAKRPAVAFLGKILFFCLICNFILLCSPQAEISAKTVSSDEKKGNINNTQATTAVIETSGPVSYKSQFVDNPPRLILDFDPQIISSQLKEEVIVNRGMVKKIYCRYYSVSYAGAGRWLKSITFILMAKTGYEIKKNENSISVSIQNIPEQTINPSFSDELVIKDYMPPGWGSAERRQAIITAIKFLKAKRQMAQPLEDTAEPSVIVEKKTDSSIRMTAANLTPVGMITAGAKVLLTQPTDIISPPASTVIYSEKVRSAVIKSPPVLKTAADVATKNDALPSDFAKASLGFLSIMVGVLVAERVKSKKTAKTEHRQQTEPARDDKGFIEEFLLKDEELQKWPRPLASPRGEHQVSSLSQIGEHQGTLNLPSITADIAERRKFPRADIRNTRGVINRALIGSKTQPYKNIRINDISKGGLSFLVRSRDLQFKMPTVIKMYFSTSPRPLDVWVKVMWEREDPKNEGKNVGVKFTRVPKETQDKIMESFGHRLG